LRNTEAPIPCREVCESLRVMLWVTLQVTL